ncbi:uncharacterized protein LOC121383142 [Gigantopelta aegis]|uniref:uncharacterized protein LOC121383142 n=1 Tax=Gigantopelta aegis TaxID=1735272 RepID=UPI001B88D3DC|nr:uncharacterized protein LOC121383142 [Gigantopelta aegis]
MEKFMLFAGVRLEEVVLFSFVALVVHVATRRERSLLTAAPESSSLGWRSKSVVAHSFFGTSRCPGWCTAVPGLQGPLAVACSPEDSVSQKGAPLVVEPPALSPPWAVPSTGFFLLLPLPVRDPVYVTRNSNMEPKLAISPPRWGGSSRAQVDTSTFIERQLEKKKCQHKLEGPGVAHW